VEIGDFYAGRVRTGVKPFPCLSLLAVESFQRNQLDFISRMLEELRAAAAPGRLLGQADVGGQSKRLEHPLLL